jgi:hypothetical protein
MSSFWDTRGGLGIQSHLYSLLVICIDVIVDIDWLQLAVRDDSEASWLPCLQVKRKGIFWCNFSQLNFRDYLCYSKLLKCTNLLDWISQISSLRYTFEEQSFLIPDVGHVDVEHLANIDVLLPSPIHLWIPFLWLVLYDLPQMFI